MNAKQILVGLLALSILSLVVAYYLEKRVPETKLTPSTTYSTSTAPAYAADAATVAEYVAKNISTLSQIKEEAGQKMRMIKSRIYDGRGTVEFGNGSATYNADFIYEVDGAGQVSITSFTIKK